MINAWYAEPDLAARLTSGETHPFRLTADYVARETVFMEIDRESGGRITSVKNRVATISVEGVLTKKPSFFAAFFGGSNTTYSEIINAIAAAENNPDVDSIDLKISSGGGQVAGMFDAMKKIRGSKKPVRAIGEDMVASAAYSLASQADTVVAASRSTAWGSVGVATTYYVSSDVIEITSTEAPEKRPDPQTDEGKASIRGFLDQLHNEMVAEIASARKTTINYVNSNYGRGGMMLSSAALDRQMIDAIVEIQQAGPDSASASQSKPEGEKMDLEKLKADHRGLYDQVMKLGADAERDRVNAHLEFAKPGGKAGMDLALAAIATGESVSQSLQAKYFNAALNARDINNASADSGDTSKVIEGAPKKPTETADEDAVHNAVLRELGVTDDPNHKKGA